MNESNKLKTLKANIEKVAVNAEKERKKSEELELNKIFARGDLMMEQERIKNRVARGVGKLNTEITQTPRVKSFREIQCNAMLFGKWVTEEVTPTGCIIRMFTDEKPKTKWWQWYK